MIEAVITGFLLGLALALSVGPVIFSIIKTRINYGFNSALSFISGVWFSDLLWIFTANFFGNLLKELLLYKTSIGIAGGTFMISLGIFFLFIKKNKIKQESDQFDIKIVRSRNLRLFITGFLINTLNPGVIGLWLAAVSQSLSKTLNQKMVIFGTCLLLNILADLIKINLAGKLKKILTSKNIKTLNVASGILFIIFGIALMVNVILEK
jgi:threonine/homoserine/homoserine lactone efflux protein